MICGIQIINVLFDNGEWRKITPHKNAKVHENDLEMKCNRFVQTLSIDQRSDLMNTFHISDLYKPYFFSKKL